MGLSKQGVVGEGCRPPGCHWQPCDRSCGDCDCGSLDSRRGTDGDCLETVPKLSGCPEEAGVNRLHSPAQPPEKEQGAPDGLVWKVRCVGSGPGPGVVRQGIVRHAGPPQVLHKTAHTQGGVDGGLCTRSARNGNSCLQPYGPGSPSHGHRQPTWHQEASPPVGGEEAPGRSWR